MQSSNRGRDVTLELEPGFNREDGLGERARVARPKRRNGAKKKPGKFAAKRSRDFIEGRMFERDRMDGYRDPQQPAEGNYADTRFGPLRIGYRS
jgi:hypothetical protein